MDAVTYAVTGIETDLPVVAIDVPSGFDVVLAEHGLGRAIAVDLEQLHRAHSLGEAGTAMLHGKALAVKVSSGTGGEYWARRR